MDNVQIFDTTLRDGEQSPGFSMNREEKLQLARQIEELGVDVIEAGFPIASPGDLDATRAVAAEIKHCRVAALARARQEDVEAALRGLEPAAKPRLHVFLATSDLHLKYKLRTTREQALEQITKMVRFGRQHCEEVEFSAEDASRTDIDYLCQVVLAAVESGATIINLPDTVGYSDAGRICRNVPQGARASRRAPERGAERALPRRSRPGACRIRSRRLTRAFARSNARSTASASAPEMLRSRNWPWRCTSARIATP